MNPLVSIVIPIYNAECFLDKCIESALHQTYRNIEIILINDGSIDDSKNICEKFSHTHNNIVFVSQENQGVSAARKKGVLLSSGNWIMFLDADDVLPANSISTLVSNISDENDIVIGQVEFEGAWKWPYQQLNVNLNRKEYLLYLVLRKIHSGPVAKLFKRKVLTEDTFSIPRDIRVGEDFIMNLRIAGMANSIKVIKDIVYRYVNNPNSATSINPFSSLKYCRYFESIAWNDLVELSSFSKFCLQLIDKVIRRKNLIKGKIKK